MPTFDFKSPDGRTYSVQGPDGATPEQAFAMLNQHLGMASAPPAENPVVASGKDALNEFTGALKTGASSVADYLNPFSDARHASYAKQAQLPLGDALKENLSQLTGTGSALAAPLTAPGNAVMGAASALGARPWQAVNSLVGVDLPLDQAKEQVGLALQGARPAGFSPKGSTGLSTPAPVPTAQEIKSAAQAGYDAAKNSGIEFKPSAVQNFVTKAQADLNADGLNEILAPKTFGVLDKMGSPPAGSTVTVNDFRTMQRSLGMAAKAADPTERLAATRALEALNSHIENLPAADIAVGTPADVAKMTSAIKEANANYASYKRASDFDLRGQKAANNAAAANSGMNLENQLRSQVRQILNNPKLQRGIDADTLEAMKDFNSGSRTANVLRKVGNLLGGGGGWGSAAIAVAGHLMIPGVGLATPAVGMAVKAAGNARALAQFENLNEMLRAASPLAKSLPPIPAPPPSPALTGLLAGTLPNAAGLPIMSLLKARADEKKH